MNNTITLKAPH